MRYLNKLNKKKPATTNFVKSLICTIQSHVHTVMHQLKPVRSMQNTVKQSSRWLLIQHGFNGAYLPSKGYVSVKSEFYSICIQHNHSLEPIFEFNSCAFGTAWPGWCICLSTA